MLPAPIVAFFSHFVPHGAPAPGDLTVKLSFTAIIPPSDILVVVELEFVFCLLGEYVPAAMATRPSVPRVAV